MPATPTLVASATARATPGSSTWTVAFTVPVGADYLRVCVDEGNTARTISGITYNSAAMTLLNQVTNGSYNARAYELVSPTADGSSHNIVVTFSGDPATTCNLTVSAFSGVDSGTARVGQALDIAGLDPVTTAEVTPTADGSLVVQDVLLLDPRTISSWDSSQTQAQGASGRYIATKTGPTPAALSQLDFNLSASSARGASLAVALAGSSDLSVAATGSEVTAQDGTPTYSGAFNAFRGLVLRWP